MAQQPFTDFLNSQPSPPPQSGPFTQFLQQAQTPQPPPPVPPPAPSPAPPPIQLGANPGQQTFNTDQFAAQRQNPTPFGDWKPDAPVKPEGPGLKDVEIGLRQGAASAMNMVTRPSDSIYGGRTASGRPLSDVVEENVAPNPRDVEARQSLGSKIIQGAARAPIDIAKYGVATAAAGGNPILGMGAADALEASGPRSSPAESLQAGVKGAAMGGVMERLAPLTRIQRAGAGAAIGAGTAAMGGASPEDIAASGIVMGGLSALHGKRGVEERPQVAEEPKPLEPRPPAEPTPSPAESVQPFTDFVKATEPKAVEAQAAPNVGDATPPAESPEPFTEFLNQQPPPEPQGQPQSQVFGMGLGALQPYYDQAVAAIQRDVAATKAIVAKRNAALAALKSAQSTPTEKAAGQKTLEYFTGERDLWGAKINQVIDRVRKLVPDASEQEGLSLMRDFKSKPGELQQWANGTHPTLTGITDPAALQIAQARIQQMQPAIAKALNPTPQMLAADHVLTLVSELSLLEGRKHGFLDSSISSEEYVTHLLHPPDLPDTSQLTETMGRALGGKLGRRFAFSEKRQYPTLLDAVADNVKPRTLNALDAFTIHGDKFATARATHMLVNELKTTGVGKWGIGGKNIPDGWVEIAPHAHPFQNTLSFLDPSGNPQNARQTLFVPKYIEEALRPTTDPDYSSKIAGFAKLRIWQAYTKSVQLGMSLFHATAENYMALANMGPSGWAKGLKADRDSGAFLDGERRFIAHGGTTSIQGKTFEAYRSLEPGSIPTWGDIWRTLPGIRQMDSAAGKLTEFTFGKLQRQFKVTDFAMKEAAWIAKNPTATAAQHASALQSIAKEVNAVYGGLHWENLGINKTSLNIARALMLAPDWTFSNLFNVKYAMEGLRPGSAPSPAGQAARMFWARQIIGGLGATQAMSLMLSGQVSKRLTQVYMGKDKDGQEIYQNMFFKGAAGDIVNTVNNVHDFGAVMGLARSMAGKAAPGLRTGMQLGMNRNYLGQEIVPRGLDAFPATVRGAWAAAKDVAPIPLSAVNVWNMLAGPKSDRYTVPEYFTTLFAGTPPSHVPPEGMRMTNTGLKVKTVKPQEPWWNQITGRPVPRPVRIGR